MKLLLVSLLFACVLAAQPQVSISYMNAAACEEIAGLIGGSILHGATLPCRQNISVGVVDSDPRTQAFLVTLTYVDETGKPQTQTAAVPSVVSAGSEVGTAWFYSVDNVTQITASVSSLIASGSAVAP